MIKNYEASNERCLAVILQLDGEKGDKDIPLDSNKYYITDYESN
ncbi:MAG: hypothetical protein ACR5KW_01465 [Wolbachia sp.]